ncbi:aminotransferase class I/II-fold pyridoxal phosphate-dependent enzyme [Janibacter limosus]|uniref:Aminotransferase class I/II-fold pyridoxal phosphate-dependent enzyme n=1 Tax=Janibacter limosus TaxID=53458 RepID=A0AC61U829_9MICO|nr:aminotransferase class I/II-fold pyridoxal phosphate-dependent enzyme [Janibacter limosus]UUZ46202.1 aminotransferase class I/II-fold pyridoxal phosphate-dependent enzyme [Janibacter limosus]
MERRVLALDETALRRRTSIKWRLHDPDVLPLWIAEMDVAPAPAVADELARIARDGDLGYPVTGPYTEAVAALYAEWGAPVEISLARPVADVMAGVRAGLAALTGQDDPVYITVPVYPPFHGAVHEIGRRLVPVPPGPTGRLDADALDLAFAEHGRGALLLSNPHNPTGTVPTRTELTQVAVAAARHGVRIVSDEIHAPLVLPGASFTPLLSLPEAQSGPAVFSPAKGWNLAAAKSAVLLGGSQAADAAVGAATGPGVHDQPSRGAAAHGCAAGWPRLACGPRGRPGREPHAPRPAVGAAPPGGLPAAGGGHLPRPARLPTARPG